MSYSSPLVSVLIITYNHEKYIAKAIDSVLMQNTNFDFEIVIGEDCSLDNTRQIVSHYEKENKDKIHVITSKENVGMIANITRIERACRGKYIAYLEGDDFWADPNKLQMQVDFLNNHPDYGLVFSDRNEYFEKDNKLIKDHNKYYEKNILSGDIFNEILTRNYIPTCTVCLRKELLEKHFDYAYFSKKNWLIYDLPRWLEISAHSKIGYIDKSLSTYRVLSESISHTKEKKRRLEWLGSRYNARFYYINKYGCPKETEATVTNDYYIGMLKCAYRYHDRKLAITAYSELKRMPDKLRKDHFSSYLYYWGSKNLLYYYLAKIYLKTKPPLQKKPWPPRNKIINSLTYIYHKMFSWTRK